MSVALPAVVGMRLSAAGLPLAVLSDGTAHAYHAGMAAWMRVADAAFPASAFHSILRAPDGAPLVQSHKICLSSRSGPSDTLLVSSPPDFVAIICDCTPSDVEAAVTPGGQCGKRVADQRPGECQSDGWQRRCCLLALPGPLTGLGDVDVRAAPPVERCAFSAAARLDPAVCIAHASLTGVAVPEFLRHMLALL